MARKKSKEDIIRNEKYMDDAISSAFFNLHKAAKKKNDYIWATNTFTSSLDSIWDEQQTGEVFDDKSGTKSLKCQNYDKSTKPSTSHLSRSNDIETKTSPNGTAGSDYEESRRNFIRRKSLSLKNLSGEVERKTDLCRNETEYSNLNMSDVKTPDLKSYNQALNRNELCKNRVKLKIHESNPDVGSRIPDVRVYEKCREIFQMKKNSSNSSLNKTENQARNGETSKADKDFKLNNSGSGILSDCTKSKTASLVTHRKEKDLGKTKKHLSSSVNRLQPVQKHSIVENQKNTKFLNNEERSIFKTMLLLKVFKGDKMHDFMLDLSNFNRIKDRYPKLKEVLPEINKGEKELAYSLDAIKIVFGFFCNVPYVTPDDKTSVEVLAACKSWEIDKFRAEFQKRFLKNLTSCLAYGASVHYNLKEICDAYKRSFNEDDLSSECRPYKQRKCYASVSTYIEPQEFCIPSKTANSTLRDNFDRDIRNEITFKAVKGSYVITGFHILLNLDNEKEIDSAYLEFFYVVQNQQNSYEEEFKLRKQCRPIIVINLNRSLEINEDQTANIVIETSIKPYLCLAIQENKIIGRCNEGQFSLDINSTYKVANSNEKRFFIGKLLYYPKT